MSRRFSAMAMAMAITIVTFLSTVTAAPPGSSSTSGPADVDIFTGAPSFDVTPDGFAAPGTREGLYYVVTPYSDFLVAQWSDSRGWLVPSTTTGNVQFEVPADAALGTTTQVTVRLSSRAGREVGVGRLTLTAGEPDRALVVTGPTALENRAPGTFTASLGGPVEARWYGEGLNCYFTQRFAASTTARCLNPGFDPPGLVVAQAFTDEQFPRLYSGFAEVAMPRDTATFGIADVSPGRDPVTRDVGVYVGSCWDLTCQPIDPTAGTVIEGYRGATLVVQRRQGARPWVSIGETRANANGYAQFTDQGALTARPAYRVLYAGGPGRDAAVVRAPVLRFGGAVVASLRGRTVSGRVTFPWGEPVVGLRVDLLRRDRGEIAYRRVAQVRTDRQGRVRFQADPGRASVRLSAAFFTQSPLRGPGGGNSRSAVLTIR